MADKPDKGGPSGDPLIEIIFIIASMIVLGSAGAITLWISSNKESWLSFLNIFYYDLINFFAKFAIFSAFFSGAAVLVLAIYVYRNQKVREGMIEKILPKGGAQMENILNDEVNPKWNIVLENINSDDPNKWKFAVLEADIILAELLDTFDLPGDNIGDKLKAVEPSDFQSIEEAWEAHKIRNAIAHEGSDFLLSEREAKRVIGLYEKVFTEFQII